MTLIVDYNIYYNYYYFVKIINFVDFDLQKMKKKMVEENKLFENYLNYYLNN